LYPPRWRRRYGAELADLVAGQPFSIGLALDLIGGAIDAWRHPQLVPSTSSPGETPMIPRIMQLACGGYGPEITRTDKVRNLAISVGGTVVLSLLWLALVWLAKRHEFSGQTYLLSAAPMMYVIPYLIGLRYTSLKGRSALSQAMVIGGTSAVVLAILMAAGWISTKI